MVNVESLNHKYAALLSLLEQQKICSILPRIHGRKLLSEFASRGIKFTDVGRDSLLIRVLLGADILGSILTDRIEVLSSEVSAVETLLGWTILGLGKKRDVLNLVTLSLQNMDVPKMWDLEILGITVPIEKKNENLLEEELWLILRKQLGSVKIKDMKWLYHVKLDILLYVINKTQQNPNFVQQLIV
ncbi:integrase catalytic domain-containing protein [Trichonephila clavipes]|nr:integrase catalytic domain-containing protein [Trichonephila clavipes]